VCRAVTIVIALLAGLIVVPLTPWVASADVNCPTTAASYAGGAGTQADPWQIATKEQFQRLKDDSVTGWDDSFILTANINMGGCVWTSTIGTPSSAASWFTGSIDGNGRVVSGLTVSVTGSAALMYAGLIGYLGPGGTVTELGFTGSVTAASSNGNALVFAGGLVARTLTGSTVSYSYATGAVQAMLVSGSPNARVGGLVGDVNGGTVTNSYATGNVSANADSGRVSVGGLVGETAPSVNASVEKSYSTGVVNVNAIGAPTVYTGGFTGFRGGTDIAVGNLWDTTSSGTSTAVGGAGSTSGIAGKTTTQMRAFSTYDDSGWAITNGWSAFSPSSTPSRVWGICAGSTRAFLLWQYTSTPCATAPGAPMITGVTPALTSAQVAFNADDSGGVSITRLEFALDDTITVDDSTTNLASPYTLGNLASGTTYSVYMRAVNVQGTGPWSAATAFTTPSPAPPPPPTPATSPKDVVARAGDASVVATWQAPTSTGSYPVTQYMATAVPGGQMCLTSTTTCTITGLTNQLTYTVVVQALTGAGWSPASEPSNAVTPRASPTKSISITGSRGAGAERRVITVRGLSTGLAGQEVTIWLSFYGRPASPGDTRAVIRDDGTFTWSRRAAREVSVYAEAGGARSRTISIRGL
jgi:hypothetical protein